VDGLREVLDHWGFGPVVTPFNKGKISVGLMIDPEQEVAAQTRGFYGERDNAAILVFGGTDPGIWQNLVTDAKFFRIGSDVHGGFQDAFDVVCGDVKDAIGLAKGKQKPLFVAGHSLGGAIAAVAAKYAAESRGYPPCAVYAFGMPRVGGDRFCHEYVARLGDNTYRLVYGRDIVPQVPPSIFGFHHVGRLLQCSVESKFDPGADLSVVGSDEPGLALSIGGIAGYLEDIASVVRLGKPGLTDGPIGKAIAALPPELRHHLPDSYFDALTPA
jgi:triacylglycerol lipase